uniref:hypothetical protein n=1 Tax=Algoriphagus sp. TaxID=1872435 RepID=UPI0040485E66
MRINKLVQDVNTIKRSLNVEHKHYDYQFGSGQTVSAQTPWNNDPVFLALTLPERGVAFNNRIGNQIRITHITSKLEFLFKNNTDQFSRTTCSARLLFAKSGDDVPQYEDLYEEDANGHYTRASFVNTQTWQKYTWIKPLNSFKSHVDLVNRYPLSNHAGTAPMGPFESSQIQNQEVTDQATVPLNLSRYYINKQTKTSIRVSFENGSDTIVSQFKPYLLLMADCPSTAQTAATILDPVSISGTIRFTYVDN